jgi:hypothetical protein
VIKRNFILLLSCSFVFLSIQNCLTESKKNNDKQNLECDTALVESFQKTGWISEIKYRSVVYIMTDEESKSSTPTEIEDKIRYEAYKQLQKEFNPSFDRHAAAQIKKLVDNFGKIEKHDKECVGSKIYFYDIEKKDLNSDFKSIKNLKK